MYTYHMYYVLGIIVILSNKYIYYSPHNSTIVDDIKQKMKKNLILHQILGKMHWYENS